MTIGTPSNPKFSLRRFTMNRRYEKWIASGELVMTTNVGGATAACVT